MVKTGEYGSWESPVTAEKVTEGTRGLSLTLIDPSLSQERVYWLEMRPDEGGQGVVCSQDRGGQVIDWTPPGYNARTKKQVASEISILRRKHVYVEELNCEVHEYGGGAFIPASGKVLFTNEKDQRVYVQTGPGAQPEPLTPPDSAIRFADFAYANGRVYAVAEDHRACSKAGDQPLNFIASFSADTAGPIATAASGADFYIGPRLSPDGTRLCWMQWNHPNMPWDATEIWVADVSSDGTISSSKKILGDGHTSYIMPQLINKDTLIVSHDRTNWWNLYEVDANTGVEKRALYPAAMETGEPLWMLGYSSFHASTDTIAFFSGPNLLLLSLYEGKEPVQLETGFDGHRYIRLGAHL